MWIIADYATWATSAACQMVVWPSTCSLPLSWRGFPSCTTATDDGGSIVRGRPYGSFAYCMVESGLAGTGLGAVADTMGGGGVPPLG
eukprot:35438-Chlamydomonas_euryale.AAC.1